MGSIRFRSLDLRGHSMAGLGFLFEGDLDWNGERAWRRVLICGDALFDGRICRTDFAEGSDESLVKNVRTKIFTLPDDTILTLWAWKSFNSAPGEESKSLLFSLCRAQQIT